MKLSDYPNLSYELKRIYKEYLRRGADPVVGLNAIDNFLIKYPLHSEALIFKARMLIVLSRNKEALTCIKAAKKVDKWKIVSSFDEAEVLTLWGKQNKAIEILWKAIEILISEATSGIDNYLLSAATELSETKRNKIQKLLKEDMMRLISGKSNPINLNRIKRILN